MQDPFAFDIVIAYLRTERETADVLNMRMCAHAMHDRHTCLSTRAK